ncbi:hypothetical protein SGCOL_008929 [Colletotrichum sp. CLE4]
MEHAGDQRGIVAEQFTKLTNDDGSPNTALRHANLDNLVSRLTPWELLHLRQLTRRISVKLAEMQDLPEELVAMISRHLRLGDAVKCTQVSKAWRQIWTSHTVIKDIAHISFPGLTATLPDTPAWDLLRPIAQKTTARNEGRLTSWLSMRTADVPLLKCTALKYDDRSLEFAKSNPITTPYNWESKSWHGFAYHNGKVAWQWDSYRFFVDDIRAMTRKLVSPPDLVVKGDKDFIVYAMTENLLILANQITKRALIVCDLDKGQHRRVTLPNRMVDLQAHKKTFAVNFSLDYYGYRGFEPAIPPPHIWNWSTGLIKLDVPDSPLTEEPRGGSYAWDENRDDGSDCNNGVIFHPTKPHILYFVSVLLNSPRPSDEGNETDTADENELKERSSRDLLLVEAHKFDNMKFVETFTYKSIRRWRTAPRFALHCQRMNSYGLFNIGKMYRPLSKDVAILNSELHGGKSKIVKSPSLLLRIINFNTMTESFVVEKRVLNGMRRPIWEHAALRPEQAGGISWNDSVYYIQNKDSYLPAEATPRWRHQFEGKNQRAICIANKTSTFVLETKSLWFEESARMVRGDGERFRSIAVDDDFVVGLCRRGYVVYNFGNPSLKGGPWSEPHQVQHYTEKDIDCPKRGCPGPEESRSRWCPICGDGTLNNFLWDRHSAESLDVSSDEDDESSEGMPSSG